MATSIEWTDFTINPLRARNKATGAVGHYCQKVSPGCQQCYASAWNERVRPTNGRLIGTGLSFDVRNADQVEHFLDESKLQEVLRRKKPAKFFWCDMTDMFADWVPDEWLDRIFAVMALTPQHTHQVLTKRSARMCAYFSSGADLSQRWAEAWSGMGIEPALDDWAKADRREGVDEDTVEVSLWERTYSSLSECTFPLPNLWLGVSCEDQERADERVPDLLQTPAAVRFISAEPLLGSVDFGSFITGPSDRAEGYPRSFEWVIVGGESGPKARPCDVRWVRDVVRQCKAADVAVFVKQLGANPKCEEVIADRKGGDMSEWAEDLRVREWPRGFTPQQNGE